MGDGGGGGGSGGDGGDGGGLNVQMHCLDEEHAPELLPPKRRSLEESLLPGGTKTQPWGELVYVPDVRSSAVLANRSSTVAAALHSLAVEMRAPPQEPLSIM